MDLMDLESAGAFVPRKIWDDFVIEKKDDGRIKISTVDLSKRR